MTRRPSLKLLENDMSTTELPATMPAVVESTAQRLSWQRSINDAHDERGLVDEQIESANRIHAATRDEAARIRDARVHAADMAMDREYADADKMLEASVTSLRNRQADIDKLIAGYEAAIGASE